MSERVTRRLHFLTGDVTEDRRQVPDGRTLQERFQDLIATTREQMGDPILACALGVRCDGCDQIVTVVTPTLPAGWVTNERGEFCPDCQ